MRKILGLSLALVIACVFTACQRYPYLSYYIKVDDAHGNSLLDTVSAPGKINVNDLWFEAILGDFHDTLRVVSQEDIEKDRIAADSAAEQAVEKLMPSNYTPYTIELKDYTSKHLMISTNIPIGIKLDECPVIVVHWTDGSTDSLQIDNEWGTMGDPDYYVNGKKVPDAEGFITLSPKGN